MSPAAERPRSRPRTAVVVGGGIAGLLAARELSLRGLRVVLTEARDHFGGAVDAHEVAGLVLDAGAESYATRNDSVTDLVHELGLADQRVATTGAGSWLHLPTGPLPMPSSGILGIPANPKDPALRPVLTPGGQRRAGMDRWLPARTGSRARTLGELVRARMGHHVLDRLVAPVTLGIHSAHPDALELDTVAPGLREGVAQYGSLGASAAVLRAQAPAGSQVMGLTGGMNQLSEALVADLSRRGARLLAGSDVIAVDRDPVRDTWLVIRRQAGGGKRSVLSGDVLVLATDGPTAVRLLGSVLPAEVLPAVSVGPEIALATLVLDEPALNRAPRGTGVLVSEEVRDVRAKALTHASAKWDWIGQKAGPDRHVLRLSYGRTARGSAGPEPGHHAVSELALPDEQLVTLALHDAGKILGVPLSRSALVGADVVHWRGAVPTAGPGHRQAVADFRRALAGTGRIAAVGAWLGGTGLASVVPDTRRAVAALDLGPEAPPPTGSTP